MVKPRPPVAGLAALVILLCAPLPACLSGSDSPRPEVSQASSASGQSEPAAGTKTRHSGSRRPAAALAPLDVSTPQGTLEAYIRAQEAADWAGTADLMTEGAQDDFNDATENMTEDDLVAAGLRFRDEAYKLESSDKTTAIFYSTKVKLYLVMTKEGGRWKIDPARTDRLNLEK